MTIKVSKPIHGGTVRAIASKSEAHRILICAALADSETFVVCSESSEDIDATVRCLTALGAEIRRECDGFYVDPISTLQTFGDKRYLLDCGESGSTLRFMLPVCGALGINTELSMGGRLPDRPLSGLYDEMVSHGCTLSAQGQSPMICEGQLRSGTYTLPGNISSQYVSGLLFALPLLTGDSVIRVTGTLESRPYVDMTIDTLRLFGIEIIENELNIFKVQGGQKYISPKKVKVNGDWSNAAFWLSAGAIGQNSVTCTGLELGAGQGDKYILEILADFGAHVFCAEDFVTVSPNKLQGIEIDAGDTPDLVPILAAIASVAEGQTVIRNAQRLRIKESDRLRTVSELLSNLGADIKETEDGLIINGKKLLTGGKINTHNDHRIAMTAAIISAKCKNHVTITGAEAVNKSYPGFFEDFENTLGGELVHLVAP